MCVYNCTRMSVNRDKAVYIWVWHQFLVTSVGGICRIWHLGETMRVVTAATLGHTLGACSGCWATLIKIFQTNSRTGFRFIILTRPSSKSLSVCLPDVIYYLGPTCTREDVAEGLRFPSFENLWTKANISTYGIDNKKRYRVFFYTGPPLNS